MQIIDAYRACFLSSIRKLFYNIDFVALLARGRRQRHTWETKIKIHKDEDYLCIVDPCIDDPAIMDSHSFHPRVGVNGRINRATLEY